ncbi:TetR/AcrR family transcriptional regulator [Halorubrum ezzemoulense]|uniref:TetR/AcrR family transcriptional regulator n=1 Tax=Halorubrum ezzemoulense TaxID=337243 RepID=UPI0023300D99|nr:TetR/AcrR family transcriptional regulator [Halorubrum ezzemoulense]MDB9250070.1 TetR/AcrR family transcriptional regulator [Halorubrum ezzemoulense]MDB9260238.1 TetR/AcrR family transcriptional regulator [Halorubrum ezzemoulense]MDB9263534.1 TetR/AcrR family transcriptional regulator [Halorubrum ezzemoulense]MDB9267206.1 TetR/AcrR family transcriptional regulator [Halorubrum ezzemoulense]MDB9270599.1 TetR/AcrR family transcriptional regulator [Halorubrum ezzemoulense]
MSRFTDRDRERIRSQLIEAGQELFTQFGFERTRISDLTEEVGIGTSTFYQFFDSKEELYVKVLLVERQRLEEKIADAVTAGETPREEVRLFLKTTLDEVQANPLISALIVDGELRTLQDRLKELDIAGTFTEPRPEGPDLPFTKRWAQLETFRYDDPELIDRLLISLVFTVRSRNAPVGTDGGVEYAQVEDALIETIVDGLFEE